MTDTSEGRALWAAATQGPWETRAVYTDPDAMEIAIPDGPDEEMSLTWHEGHGIAPMSLANAAHIVWLHNNAEALLDALDAVERSRKGSERTLTTHKHHDESTFVAGMVAEAEANLRALDGAK